jgi:hypothetical protein
MSAKSSAKATPAEQSGIQEGELLPLSEAQPKSAVVEYTQTEAALAELRGRLKNVVFDVKTTAGDKAARAARKELVTLRTSLDEKRLELNAKDQERIRGRNAEAKRITTEIEALEAPLDKQIKAEEERKAAEKKAREEIERQRIAALQTRVDEIRQYPLEIMGASSEHIESIIKKVVDLAVDDTFQELKQQAEGAKATTLIRLRAAHANALKMEAEQQRLAEERARLEQERAEEEQRQYAQRQRLAEEERLARLAREEDEHRAKAAREAEERRQAEERQLGEMRLQEIQGIQHQVMIATLGRAGVRKGGTRECIVETLAETEAWDLTEERFGPVLLPGAQRVKANAIEQIKQLLAQWDEGAETKRIRLENEAVAQRERQRLADERAEAERRENERRAAAEAEERRLAKAREQLEREQEALRQAQERAAAPPVPAPIPVAETPAAELVAPQAKATPSTDQLRQWAADPSNTLCWGLDAVADELERQWSENASMETVLHDLEDSFTQQVEQDLNAPDDHEYTVILTAQQWRAMWRALSGEATA